jgi:hypothetical protein
MELLDHFEIPPVPDIAASDRAAYHRNLAVFNQNNTNLKLYWRQFTLN